MTIEVLKSKIHRCTVTEANLDYIGSISIDETLMIAAQLNEFEKVHVLNITNGERLITYVIKAPKNSGEICINGAAAHLVQPKDKVIIVAYRSISEKNTGSYQPTIIHVNSKNKITS